MDHMKSTYKCGDTTGKYESYSENGQLLKIIVFLGVNSLNVFKVNFIF